MNKTTERSAHRRIHWLSVLTVGSAAILIGTEVFGAAFAGGWAVAHLFGISEYANIVQGLFALVGVAIMVSFVNNAQRVEPFITAD
jgi:hypothetical protein